MSLKLCFKLETPAGYTIKLHQRRRDCFRVTYGSEVHDNLDYATACYRLGQAIMHASTCVGKVRS